MGNNPTLIMMCGLPGSGKSTYAKDFVSKQDEKWVIHSSDELRRELLGDQTRQDKNDLIFSEMHSRIARDLVAGINVIYDACNIQRKNRMAFIQFLKQKKVACDIQCVFMAAPFKMCVSQNSKRFGDDRVPDYVIRKMYRQFCTPWEFGFDNVHCVKMNEPNNKIDPNKFVEELMTYDQETKWHSLSLGDHMENAKRYITHRRGNKILQMAALLHDCGKPETKRFLNTRNEKIENAHYYAHENCGAYDVLSGAFDLHVLTDHEILEVATIIEFHMRPYSGWKSSEKAMKRDKKILGYLYDSVLKIHEADRLAH